MNTESETPRVNDYIGIGNEDHMTEGEIAVCDFARQLERELNEATKQRDELANALSVYITHHRLRGFVTASEILKAEQALAKTTETK